jgi:hypothetical protein
MPAKDRYYQAVRNTLEADGWTINKGRLRFLVFSIEKERILQWLPEKS